MQIYHSPHYNYRPAGMAISMIVIHATANSTLDGLTSWFLNPNSYVSAHYGIGKDGQVEGLKLRHPFYVARRYFDLERS